MKKHILIAGMLIGFAYGVNAYNQADLDKLLKTNSCPGGDLSEAQLSYKHFIGSDLSKAKLIKADITESTFEKGNLNRAKLCNVKSYCATFNGANLTGANMSDGNFESSYFIESNFTDAHIWRANFSRANFSFVDLSQLNVNKIVECNFEKAYFYRDNFTGLGISRSHFGLAKFQDCNFTNTSIIGCDFAGAYLFQANFEEAKLNNTSFEGADLTQANIKTAEFTNVTMPNGEKYTGKGKDYRGPLRIEGNYPVAATSSDPVAKYLSEMPEPEKEKLRMVLMRQSELLDVDTYMVEDIIHNRKLLQKEGKDDSHIYDTNTIEIMDKLSKEVPGSNL